MLLLNRVLTVEPAQARLAPRPAAGKRSPTRPSGPWPPRQSPLVAILWGRDARDLAPLLGGVPLIESPHPSPNSADRGFFGSRPFSRASALLEEQGAGGIDWKLP